MNQRTCRCWGVLVWFFIAILTCGANLTLARGLDPDKQQQLQALLARVPLPEAYSVRGHRYRDGEENPSEQIEAWIAMDWCVWLQSKVEPVIGFAPFEYFHGTDLASWRYHFSRRVAERSDEFRVWRRSGAEQMCSPLYLIRVLRNAGAEVDKIADIDSELTEVTLSHPQLFPKGTRLSFDRRNGWIKHLTVLGRDGDVVSETRFEDWRQLASGKSVPFQIYVDLPGSSPINMMVLMTQAEEVSATTPPARLPMASDFIIVDQIEGMSKKADGTVLGPIERGVEPTGVTSSRPPGTTGPGSRTVMLIGVGLILLAGIVFGIRRWKGA